MAKNRIRKKNKSKKSGSPIPRKRLLTQDEMLARVPVNKEWLTTPDVRHIFNDCHEVTIYKWVHSGDLKAFRVTNRRKANLYKSEDVIALILKRCTPRPLEPDSSSSTISERTANAEDEEDPDGEKASPTPQAKAKRKKRKKTKRRRTG